MVNEGATGAILVTSGEFSPAAEQAATRQGHVQLIDGQALRTMLGPLPEPDPPASSTVPDPDARWQRDAPADATPASRLAREFGTAAADRLMDAFDTRVGRSGRVLRKSAEAALWGIFAKFAVAALMTIKKVSETISACPHRAERDVPVASQGRPRYRPGRPYNGLPTACRCVPGGHWKKVSGTVSANRVSGTISKKMKKVSTKSKEGVRDNF